MNKSLNPYSNGSYFLTAQPADDAWAEELS